MIISGSAAPGRGESRSQRTFVSPGSRSPCHGASVRAAAPNRREAGRRHRRPPATISSYRTVGDSFADYQRRSCGGVDVAGIRRDHVEAYLAGMRDRGLAAATVAKHYRSLQQLFTWLVEEGELAASPMALLHQPTVPEQPVPVLEDGTVAALLVTCSGSTFENRRDSAIIRLLLDTGMRAGELCGLSVTDVDFEQQIAFVLGKGGRHRACPFGAKSADALRRYLRTGNRHPGSDEYMLWRGLDLDPTCNAVRIA